LTSGRINVIRISGLSLSILSTVAVAGLGATSVATAVILGLLVAIITLLVDLILSTELVRIDLLAAIDLSKRLVADKNAATHLRAMSSAMTKISREGTVGGLFYREAVRALLHCSTSLSQLAQGELTLEEVRRMESLIYLIDAAKGGASIFMTSYVQIDDWWETPVGRQYLKANFRAVERGVSITRIFIVRPDDGDPLKTFAEAQATKLNVRLVEESRVEPAERENFFLIENRVVSFADYSREGRLLRGRISTSSSTLVTYREKFESLRLIASTLNEFYSQPLQGG
jgi:hypothetical protein